MALAVNPKSPNISLSQNTFQNAQTCPVCKATVKKLQRCSGCHFAKYCGLECQKKDWPKHKKVCKVNLQEENESKGDHVKIANTMSACFQKVQNQSDWRGTAPISHSLLPFKNRQEMWGDFAFFKPGTILAALKQFCTSNPPKQNRNLSLDLGCGNGRSSFYLLEKGWDVEAYDSSKEAIQIFSIYAIGIKEKFSQRTLHIHNKDITKCDFPPKTNLILSCNVLPYCDPKKIADLFLKIYNSLDTNGHFIGTLFTTSKTHELNEIVKEMGAWFIDDLETAKELLEATGYIIKYIRHFEDMGIIEFLGSKIDK